MDLWSLMTFSLNILKVEFDGHGNFAILYEELLISLYFNKVCEVLNIVHIRGGYLLTSKCLTTLKEKNSSQSNFIDA